MMDTEILKQQVSPNAREYIERLEAELAKVTTERDALKPNRHCKWQDGEVCMHPFNQPENCLIGPCNLQRKPTHEP